MADTKARKNRTITANVKSFEELVSVKTSIYPWQDLKSGDGNFFVACDDEAEARTLKGSIRSSGLNFYLKRKIKLVPVVVVAKIDDAFGVVCSAIAAE